MRSDRRTRHDHVALPCSMFALAVFACGGGTNEPAGSETSGAEASGPAGETSGAIASAAPASHDTPREPADASQPEGVLALHMGNYFWMVLEARDALIAGGLNRARSRMRQLSEQEYRTVVPAPWHADLEHLLDEARHVAEAHDLREGSEALARVAVACGDCHGKLHAGPLPGAERLGQAGRRGEDLNARMLRHQWAADAMWSGLTRPSDAEWRAGAQALVNAPLLQPPDSEDGSLDQAQLAAVRGVREIGQHAMEAAGPEARAHVYAELLQSCSGCHRGF